MIGTILHSQIIHFDAIQNNFSDFILWLVNRLNIVKLQAIKQWFYQLVSLNGICITLEKIMIYIFNIVETIWIKWIVRLNCMQTNDGLICLDWDLSESLYYHSIHKKRQKLDNLFAALKNHHAFSILIYKIINMHHHLQPFFHWDSQGSTISGPVNMNFNFLTKNSIHVRNFFRFFYIL